MNDDLKTELERVKQQLAATQRVLRAVQRRNTSMWKAYTRLLDCQSAAELALELRSERTQRAFQVSTGERLFSESEVRPLVDALEQAENATTCVCVEGLPNLPRCHYCAARNALAHAKEIGL